MQMKDITLATHLQGLGAPLKAPSVQAGSGFEDALKKVVGEVNRAQIASDRAVESLHAGGSKNLHEVMIAMEKADISLRLLVQMRNKAIESYQEVMRMQV